LSALNGLAQYPRASSRRPVLSPLIALNVWQHRRSLLVPVEYGFAKQNDTARKRLAGAKALAARMQLSLLKYLLFQTNP